MNRITKELRARNGIINGRRWTTYRRKDARGFEISEFHPATSTYLPNHWTDKSENARIFALLDKAASWRHRAQAYPRYRERERRRCLEYARDALAMSGRLG